MVIFDFGKWLRHMKTENCPLKGLQAIWGRPYQSCYMLQFHFAFTMVVPVEKLSNCLNLTQSSDSTLFHTAHQKKKLTNITGINCTYVYNNYWNNFLFCQFGCSFHLDRHFQITICIFWNGLLMIWASYKIFRFSWTWIWSSKCM